MSSEYTLALSGERLIRRRTRRDPNPRFKAERTMQLDAISGCPELQVPTEHLARTVREQVAALDVSEVEKGYSSLGRSGYHPRNVLAVWIYASVCGLHHAAKVARAMKTDAAYWLLSGGYQFSSATLKRFRQKNGVLFADAIEQTVRIAEERGLLEPGEVSIDSVRLRAHASSKELRTQERASQRLEELAQQDPAAMSEAERADHEQRRQRAQKVVQTCAEQGRSDLVRTNELAARQKFPGGGVHLGHRVTVGAAGRSQRLVVAVLVDAEQSDSGKLQAAVEQARAVLLGAGVPPEVRMRVTADSGYAAERDLAFAAANHPWVDVLVPVDGIDRSKSTKRGFFGRERFVLHANGTATCPADRLMRGPYKDGPRRRYEGLGCTDCSLRAQCTEKNKRVLNILPTYDRLRAAMHDRMTAPDAKDHYKGRMATIEPVFSSIEHGMGFRRSSSRHADTVVAEILLKFLAHNLLRLASARRSSCVFILIEGEF